MRIEPQVSSASIVLVGSFNPSIFQPYWFARYGLISDVAAESAEVAVVHPEVTDFTIGGQFHLRVERERFAISREAAPLILISDISVRIFSDLLPHTPVRAVGINRAVHFDVGSAEERDRIGMLLAPREPWGAWGEKVFSGEGVRHGGMRSLALIQLDVPGRDRGSIEAKIEPSAHPSLRLSGVFMHVNDHYGLAGDGKFVDAAEAAGILESRFDLSMHGAEEIIDQIMSLKK